MADASQPNDHILAALPVRGTAPFQDLERLAERVRTDNFRRRLGLIGVCFLGATPALAVVVLLIVVAMGSGTVGSILLGFAILSSLFLGLFYCWALFAFLHYRHGRQEELWQVLTAAVQAQAPLPQALRAYLRDRPRGLGRKLWVAG